MSRIAQVEGAAAESVTESVSSANVSRAAGGVAVAAGRQGAEEVRLPRAEIEVPSVPAPFAAASHATGYDSRLQSVAQVAEGRDLSAAQRQRFNAALSELSSSGKLDQRAVGGDQQTLLTYLNQIANCSQKTLGGIPKAEMLLAMVEAAANPKSLTQGDTATCVVSERIRNAANIPPAEMARLVSELLLEGKTTLAGGAELRMHDDLARGRVAADCVANVNPSKVLVIGAIMQWVGKQHGSDLTYDLAKDTFSGKLSIPTKQGALEYKGNFQGLYLHQSVLVNEMLTGKHIETKVVGMPDQRSGKVQTGQEVLDEAREYQLRAGASGVKTCMFIQWGGGAHLLHKLGYIGEFERDGKSYIRLDDSLPPGVELPKEIQTLANGDKVVPKEWLAEHLAHIEIEGGSRRLGSPVLMDRSYYVQPVQHVVVNGETGETTTIIQINPSASTPWLSKSEEGKSKGIEVIPVAWTELVYEHDQPRVVVGVVDHENPEHAAAAQKERLDQAAAAAAAAAAERSLIRKPKEELVTQERDLGDPKAQRDVKLKYFDSVVERTTTDK